jgi:thiamine-phosphate pyrophosphorylase
VYAIVDSGASVDPVAVTEAVVRGGVRLVQYRSKAGVDRALVRRLHHATARAGALLIVNDDPVAAHDADGLHVGQEDLAAMPPGIRDRLSGRILGVSCGTASEARAAVRLGADYLGVGPFAVTSSKADAGEAIGPAGTAAVVDAAGAVPVAAIGGITLERLGEVAATGAAMAAVLSALVGSGDPEFAARAFVERWARLRR